MGARLCAGSPIVIAGVGNSAGQAALFLAASGSPVTSVIRGHGLDASMSRYLVDRIEAEARIDVRINTRITGLDGDPTFTSGRVTTGASMPCCRASPCSPSSAPSRPRVGCRVARPLMNAVSCSPTDP
jgi:hypothetical protein